MFRAGIVFLALLLLSLPFDAFGAERVALVVGNNEYQNSPSLENPVNDANLISAALRQVGFDVITVTDGTHRKILSAVSEFGRKSAGAEVSLFFYAGHGLEVAGRNWVLPVDASVEVSSDLPATAIKVDDVLETMELSGANVRMVILDACRNNPLSRSLTRSAGRGLARIDASAAGTMIVFSAAPGEVAADGDGGNSPFTAALASHITREGLEVRQMLGRVRQEVMAATDNQQVPWVNEAVVGDFYIASAPGGEEDAIPESTPPRGNPGPSADLSVELAFWDSVKDSRNKALITLYLEKYPNGAFVDLAKVILASLENGATGAPRGDNPQITNNEHAALNLMEREAHEFVQRFNRVASGPPDRALAQLGSFYADNVRFYGRLYSLADIVEDKRKLLDRWPDRNYQSPDGEVRVRCDQALQKCDVQSKVYWDVYSPARNQRANGIQRTYFELEFSQGVPKIVFEEAENITGE